MTRDYSFYGPYLLTSLAWVALPGAHAPTSVALLVNWARKLPLHDKAIVLKEVYCYQCFGGICCVSLRDRFRISVNIRIRQGVADGSGCVLCIISSVDYYGQFPVGITVKPSLCICMPLN